MLDQVFLPCHVVSPVISSSFLDDKIQTCIQQVVLVLTICHVHDLYSAVNISEAPAVATVEKKEYVYETKEEAKQAFKELLREKVSYHFSACIELRFYLAVTRKQPVL